MEATIVIAPWVELGEAVEVPLLEVVDDGECGTDVIPFVRIRRPVWVTEDELVAVIVIVELAEDV